MEGRSPGRLALRRNDRRPGRPRGRPRAAAVGRGLVARPNGQAGRGGSARGPGDLRRGPAAGIGAAGVRPSRRGPEGEDRGDPDGQRGRGRAGRDARRVHRAVAEARRRLGGLAPHPIAGQGRRAGVHPAARGGHGRLVQRRGSVPRDRRLPRHGRRAGPARGARPRRGPRRHVGRRRADVAGDDHRRAGQGDRRHRVRLLARRRRSTSMRSGATGSIDSSGSWPIIPTCSAWRSTSRRRWWSARGAGKSWATHTS